MEEIKAPLHKRILYFLYSHIALFGLLILIAVVLFSSCGKAKAAEEYLPTGFSNILEEDLIHFNVANYYDTVYSYFSNKMTVNGSITRLVSQDGTFVHYVLFPVSQEYYMAYSGITNFDNSSTTVDAVRFQANYNNTIRQYASLSNTQLNQGDTIYLQLFLFNGGRIWLIDNVTSNTAYYNMSRTCYTYSYDLNTFGSPVSSNIIYNGYWGNANWIIESGYSSSYSTICNISEIISYNGFGFQSTGNSYSIYYFEDNWETYFPSAVEDSRLKLSTIMDNGRKELAIDFSDFFTEEYASSYQINDLTLTISYDGTEQEITGLSQYYQSISTTDKMAFIPYTALGFDANNEIQYNDVEVINCSFTKAVIYPNRPGTTEDFNILCSYYLKKTTVPIEADTVNLDDTIYEDVVSDTTITDTLNEIGVTSTSNSDGVWSNFTLVNTLPTFPSWCSTINIAIWQSKVWENGGWSYRDEWYYKGDDVDFNTWYHEAYPFDLPYANNYALYYDVLIINLGDGVKQMSVAGTPHDFPTNQAWGDYIILYSARYYQHKNVEGLYSLIDAFQKDANQSKENWSYLKERLDDFENKTLEAMTSTTEPTSIFYKLNTLDNDLMNGVTRIVNKIPSPFDDTDILDAISDVADSISSISFPTTDMSTTNSLLERINAVLGGQDDESTLLKTPYALHNLYPLLQLLNGEENKLVVFDTTPPSSPSNDVIYITVNSEWWATTFNSIIGGYLGLKGSIPIDDVSDFFITFYDALYGRTIDTVPDYAPGDSEKQITNFNRMFSRIYDYDFDPSLYWGEVQIGE